MSDAPHRSPWLPGNAPQADSRAPADAPAPEPEIASAPVPVPRPAAADAPAAEVRFPDFPQSSEPVRRQSVLSPYLAPRIGETLVPEPIEVEDAEIIRPILAPPADEILPRSGAIPTVPPAQAGFEPVPHNPSATRTFDPVRALSETAIANAALAAAGAPVSGVGTASSTPNGEVAQHELVPAFGEESPFVPRFEPLGGTPTETPHVSFNPTPASAVGTPASASPQFAPTPVASPLLPTNDQWRPVAAVKAPSSADFDAANRRVQEAGASAVTAHQASVKRSPTGFDPVLFGDFSQQGDVSVEASAPKESKPWFKKAWVWIVVGVLLAGGGFAAYRMFFMPEPIILPAPVVTEPAPEPQIEPVAVDAEATLVAKLPHVVTTWVLTSYEVVEPERNPDLGGRIAEQAVLAYGAAAGETLVELDVFQFYNSTEAQNAFTYWASDGTLGAPVEVSGQVVGESASILNGTEVTIIWRNGSLVFMATGPEAEVTKFFTHFGM